jgi:hypothetical protein
MNDDISEERWRRLRESTREQKASFSIRPMEHPMSKLAPGFPERNGHSLDREEKRIERHLRDQDQRHIASALRARRTNKHQSIGW